MSAPLVSIIIPNYNHAAFLEQRIASVLNQSYQGFEVILLDDCSTDDSIKVLESYKSHPKVAQVVLNTQNSGSPFKQWQKGIALAKGDYIWIAESDDYCQLNFLEEILAAFHKNSNLGIVYAQSSDVDENGKKIAHRSEYTKEFQPNIWRKNFSMNGRDFIKSYLSYKNVIPNASAVVFKKNAIKKNTFSRQMLQMKMCGDWLFWVLLCLQTDIGFIAEDLNFFRNHAAVSRNHNDRIKKKQRLLEEKIIREALDVNQLNNIKHTNKLYRKWFKLHNKRMLLSRSFYSIKLKKTTIFSFLFQVKSHFKIL
mgnify:CR=1 FL=1